MISGDFLDFEISGSSSVVARSVEDLGDRGDLGRSIGRAGRARGRSAAEET